MLVDYAEHFWGEKHHGYHVLYENLKKGEDSVHELSTFIKERISLEEDLQKYLHKNLMRVNQYINNNGAFVDAWRLTRGTLELYSEIQTSVLKNLIEISKEIIKYHDDLVKSRKRVKEQDVIDAVNLMQTTTTCLQKAKETYQHRCSEFASMKSEPQTKEFIKMRSKVAKSHEEYKAYVEKYGVVRDNFEEKMIKASRSFQAHDNAHLQQMKSFFVKFAKSIDETHNSISQVTTDYRQNLNQIDLENIMVRFVEEKGTGIEKPEPIKWTESDELSDMDVVSHITSSQSAPSSSNSSAIVAGMTMEGSNHPVTNLVDLDSPTWTPAVNASDKSPGDSDAEGNLNSNSAHMPQFSSSLGRQKLAQWLPRRKKNCSQSSLPATDETFSATGETLASKGGFLKRYRKAKNSINDLTSMNENKDPFQGEDTKSTTSSAKSDDKSKFGNSYGADDALTPTVSDLPNVDAEGYIIRNTDDSNKRNPYSTCSSSSSENEDEGEFQASKFRSLQIKPVNESNTQINASVDELRSVMGHISLQRSTTFDKDPWSVSSVNDFSQSLNSGGKQPMRAAFTGDEHLRRKSNADIEFINAFAGFSHSSGGSPAGGSSIARARPRSNTPTALAASAFGLNSSISGMNSVGQSDSANDIFGSRSDISAGNGFGDSFANFGLNSVLKGSTSTLTCNENRVARNPLAMAVNEYVHAWFKKDNKLSPEVKVFGTVVISFPAVLFNLLTEVNENLKPIKLSLENAQQIQTVTPNKRLILPAPISSAPQDLYKFTIDKIALANWLLDQKREKPTAQFYNVDIIRYELQQGFVPPITMTTYWKTGQDETAILVDYKLNSIPENPLLEKALLNVTFTTQVDGEAELTNAIPEASFDPATGQLKWQVTEITRHGEPAGVMKARLKLAKGPSNTVNTYVQFQSADTNMSNVTVCVEPEGGYNLSMVRKKVISGKYFSEPEVR